MEAEQYFDYCLEVDKAKAIHTEEDYYNVPDEKRVEMIRGLFYDMAAPSIIHQRVAGALFRKIADHIDKKGGSCIVVLEVEVKPCPDENNNIVIPDIVVVCDPEKLSDRRVEGAPDWIIEIASPSNYSNDYLIKLDLYRHARVREYWIVDPMTKAVIIYNLSEGDVRPNVYTMTDKITSLICDDLIIDMGTLGL